LRHVGKFNEVGQAIVANLSIQLAVCYPCFMAAERTKL
jgi:hypothetical protein